MSITLNNSDFQCLQDQLVDLKTKNYELAEKNRRGQADFETAKAKICSLQLKLEEQERDFQVISSTLRREVELAYSNNSENSATNNGQESTESNKEGEGSYKNKYKKLLHKARELQQRYDNSLGIVQQMDGEIKTLNERVAKLENEITKLNSELDQKDKLLTTQDNEYEKKLNSALEECKNKAQLQLDELKNQLDDFIKERDHYRQQSETSSDEVKHITSKLEQQMEERKIQDKKGMQIVKELKRQLTIEKNKSETLQKRLENLLANGGQVQSSSSPRDDIESNVNLSTATSSSSNSNTTNGNGSWSLVPTSVGDKTYKSNLSICSIDLSDDRETVQHNLYGASVAESCSALGESKSESGSHNVTDETNHAHQSWSASASSTNLQSPQKASLAQQRRDSSQTHASNISLEYSGKSTMQFEEQMALMERLTRLQQDKWTLEEKLSYLEHANFSLSEELANKSEVIKHYFIHKASVPQRGGQQQINDLPPFLVASGGHKRISFPSNINQMLSDNSGIKKVVDFLKERSQQVANSSGESESVTREAAKKMQLMLEETLMKNLKLEESLDLVSKELNKLKK